MFAIARILRSVSTLKHRWLHKSRSASAPRQHHRH